MTICRVFPRSLLHCRHWLLPPDLVHPDLVLRQLVNHLCRSQPRLLRGNTTRLVTLSMNLQLRWRGYVISAWQGVAMQSMTTSVSIAVQWSVSRLVQQCQSTACRRSSWMKQQRCWLTGVVSPSGPLHHQHCAASWHCCRDERLSWPSLLTYSGWVAHVSGQPLTLFYSRLLKTHLFGLAYGRARATA